MGSETNAAPKPFAAGITGHRPNRLKVCEHRLLHRLREVLGALGRGAAGRPRTAVSSLAEGSDRLFAAAAADAAFALHVLLPFASSDYEQTFGDTATIGDYRSLLARAAAVRELPGTLADAEAAYEAVGRALVDAVDILVTVWDGKPAAGRGGSPEIIDYALSCGRPVVWVDATRDVRPRLLRWPTAGGPRRVALATLAGRAPFVTMRQLRRLAAHAAHRSAAR